MSIFTVVFSYIASIIGAGFASGQEIVSFFLRYGKMSILGIALAAFIFGLFEYCVLDECREHKITRYDDYAARVMPKALAGISKRLTLIFSGVCFCTMAAGGGAMFSQLFDISAVWGNILICALSLVFIIPKNQTALKYNAVFGGVIIAGIISCCIYILCFREHQAFLNTTKLAVSSVSYAGYNLITAGLILVKLSRYISTRSEAAAAAVFTFLIMLFVMTLMWAILAVYYGKINLGEIPMLTMAKRHNNVLLAVYSALLLVSLLPTAIAAGVGVTEFIDRKYSVPVLAACAFAFGSSGFANLINTAYRICGYFGIIFSVYIIAKKLKSGKKKRISENTKENG
ncbi:MAG: hypothetical protein LUD03_03495 [Firmicutes bacterium]|nr:hypothetical protein [Bacillota bacterium]